VQGNTGERLLNEGKPAIGRWLSLPPVLSAGAVAHAGFDWISNVGDGIVELPSIPMVPIIARDLSIWYNVVLDNYTSGSSPQPNLS
jgi:hypothetical protein